jgi:GDP-D-mannose 3',5'-epimerase
MGFIENNKALCMLTVLTSTHKFDAPKGVNGRNSNNTMIMDRLCWTPSIKLRDGMERTYRWIHDEYMAKYDK